MSDTVFLYTDGSYSRSSQVGGYGFLLKYKEHEFEGSGNAFITTNNRMELIPVIEGLRKLKKKCEDILVVSDSTYVVETINKWIHSFISDPTRPNYDLINDLYQEMKKHNMVRAEWVRGHNGHPLNERVNKLAQTAMEERKKLKEILGRD